MSEDDGKLWRRGLAVQDVGGDSVETFAAVSQSDGLFPAVKHPQFPVFLLLAGGRTLWMRLPQRLLQQQFSIYFARSWLHEVNMHIHNYIYVHKCSDRSRDASMPWLGVAEVCVSSAAYSLSALFYRKVCLW